MTRSLGQLTVLAFLTSVGFAAAQSRVEVSTNPSSFPRGTKVTVEATITNGNAEIQEARAHLQVIDDSRVYLSTYETIKGGLKPNEKKSHSFVNTFSAPTAPKGILTVSVWVLSGDEDIVGEPGNPWYGARRFVSQCTASDAKQKAIGRVQCVYKTPAQIAIEATAKKP